MAVYFITGTGTGIGKTLLTCTLVHQLRAAGKPVSAIKPLLSGYDADMPEASDSGQILEAMGQELTDANIRRITPFVYSAPLSPFHAAQAEDKVIDPNELEAFCQRAVQENANGTLLIEGAGGVAVPIAPGYTSLRLMQRLGLPVILVAGTYLGSLSHALTAISTLRHTGVMIAAIVVSASEESAMNVEETADTLRQWSTTPVPRIFTLPRITSTTTPWEAMPHLLEIFE